MISAVNGRKCEVPIDNRAARLAELLVDQIDGIHRALAHIGFLYVAAIKELIEKKGF